MTRSHATAWRHRAALAAVCAAAVVAHEPTARAQNAFESTATSDQVLAAIAAAKARLDVVLRQRATTPVQARGLVSPSAGTPPMSPGGVPAGAGPADVAGDQAVAGTDLYASIQKLQALQDRLRSVDLAHAMGADGDPHLQAASGAIQTGLGDLIDVLGRARENEGGGLVTGSKNGAR